ncbi:MAG: hypothetical protein MZV70_35770 [Desulfobacterales bacterium]|nr:hypothetical protein [Desulfobacterales bacterium]
MNRPLDTELVEAGTNETTPSYRTRRLYLESELIPREGIEREEGRARAFRVRQLVSNTWIGETGKGYQVRGIWMDADLSKFFSKLFLPEGKRVFPSCPSSASTKTVCVLSCPCRKGASRKRSPSGPGHRALGLPQGAGDGADPGYPERARPSPNPTREIRWPSGPAFPPHLGRPCTGRSRCART